MRPVKRSTFGRPGLRSAALRAGFAALGILALVGTVPRPWADAAQGPLIVETHRIRLTNSPGGSVEVSLDAGRTWDTIGHVTHPASVSAVGSRALEAAQPGTVSGTASEYITVRVPTVLATPRWIRVSAASEPRNNAAYQTDIPAGESLFRYLAPMAGSRALLDRETRQDTLPTNYVPKAGDRLLIICERSPDSPTAVVLENKVGGQVAMVTPLGEEKIIGQVRQPLRGIGRYDGTARAGQGAVVAYHGPAIMVSTAGRMRKLDAENKPVEERGGFVIQPQECELKGATHPDSQMLVEAAAAGPAKPPLSALFGLPVPLSSTVPADTAPTHVEMRVDGGDWEPFPDLRGGIDAADFNAKLGQALGNGRQVKEGITHLRITPAVTALSTYRYFVRLAGAPRAADGVQQGRVTITVPTTGTAISFVSFFLDGNLTKVTNQLPFSWDWDTTRVANGWHLIEIRGADEKGTVVNTVVKKALVDN